MHELLAGRRLLVVEDEMMVLMIIEDMLTELGCESVTAASSVEEAVALVQAEVFDLAMLDMNLKGRRSDAVAAALASRGVPFVFSTGYTGRDMADGVRGRPLLTKPYQRKQLATALGALLAPLIPSAALLDMSLPGQ